MIRIFSPQILISVAKNTLLSNSINWPDYAKVPLKMESAAGYKILKIYSFFCFPDWLTMLKRTFQIALWSTKINKVVNLFFFQSELQSFCWVGVLFENNSQASIVGTWSRHLLMMHFLWDFHHHRLIVCIVRLILYAVWLEFFALSGFCQVHWRLANSVSTRIFKLYFCNAFWLWTPIPMQIWCKFAIAQKVDNFMHLSAPILVCSNNFKKIPRLETMRRGRTYWQKKVSFFF